uniref:Serpentine Receptor, class T n=1 Tax=Strongyloides stercoralis TaxID=6248 RepID=A0A0K0EJC2_STRER
MIRVFLTSETYHYYFNCSFYTQQEWWKEGEPNPEIGIIYITLGIIFIILYIPSLLVMIKKELFKLSCYKIMFFTGIFDIVTLTLNSVLSGYLGYIGAVACNYPLLNYICGAIALFGWVSTSTARLTLAINRMIDFYGKNLGYKLFKGYKTYLWLLISFTYGLLAGIFSNPPGFTSKKMAWFYDPYFGTKIPSNIPTPNYINMVQVCHNILVTSIMTIVYILSCILISFKYQTSYKINFTTGKGSLFIQSFIICSSSFFAALINVIMQYLDTPDFVVIIGHFLWIITQGTTPVILLIFNKNIQRIIKMYFFTMLKKPNITKTSKTRSAFQKKNIK